MRYLIDFNKVVNQLTPWYIRGRKLTLLLSSLVEPLFATNQKFSEWAKETRIEASMTSQIFKFEWYLNYKLSKYFAQQDDRISINTQIAVGTSIYYESSEQSNLTIVARNQNEGIDGSFLTSYNESFGTIDASFIVSVPKINNALITTDDFNNLLSFYVDRYKLAGKTYLIKNEQ